jgi:hypothetical protein
MRTGISLSVTFADRARLRVLVKDRNASQKHVWRAQIVLLTAEGVGTSAIMRDTGKSKTCVWRWQERFADSGFEGLLRDKTRPSRISKLDPSIAERVITLTLATPPGETTHWNKGCPPFVVKFWSAERRLHEPSLIVAGAEILARNRFLQGNFP